MAKKTKATPWEWINDTTDRLRVHNGWLVRTRLSSHQKYGEYAGGKQNAISMAFVVDQVHQWELPKEEYCGY